IPYLGQSLISARQMPGFWFGVEGRDIVSTSAPTDLPVDAVHHVGPMQEFESLVPNAEPGVQTISWDNRFRPEVETEYDPPAPDIPIRATLTVTEYAVAFRREGNAGVRVENRLAGVEGRVHSYDATPRSSFITGTGLHVDATVERVMP